MPVIGRPTILIEIKSISGQTYEILDASVDSSSLLDVRITFNKIGGLSEFSFQLEKTTEVILSKNSTLKFYVNGLSWGTGYVEIVPTLEQSDPVIKVEGKGFFHRLKNTIVNESYADETLAYIHNDVCSKYITKGLDILYILSNQNIPNITGVTIEFKNKTLFDTLFTLISIMNKDYPTEEYIFYIDEEKELVTALLPSDIQDVFFEGHDFIGVELNNDYSNTKNKITVYRATSGSGNSTELVGTYDDTPSQEKHGLFESKMTFPNFVDTGTIENIITFIFAKYGEPLKSINIKDLRLYNRLSFGRYTLNSFRQLFLQSLVGIEDTDSWETTNMYNTAISTDFTRALNGRSSLKIESTSSSKNDYMTFVLEEKIAFPKKARIVVYYDGVTLPCKITFYSSTSSVELPISIVEVPIGIDDTGDEYELTVDSGGVEYNLAADVNVSAIADQWLLLDIDLSYLKELVEIRFEVSANVVTTMFLDAVQIQANSYPYNTLTLEEIEYRLTVGTINANCSFGQKAFSLIDELKEGIKENNIALDIFSKD